ncbi:MAG: hypothetical protein HFH76_18335 [Lachnospiraceae bacterium]|nr:hypothetical protein [Lachnospiraceae bacterium]
MEFIAHRINTLLQLQALPTEFGVELDLRDDLNGKIYIQHDPFEPGEDFEEYLKQYHHGTMIINVKSERIESKILEMISKYDVKSYFFLDSSFPMIWFLSNRGEKNMAIRVSEVEGIDTARNMAGKVGWIWVDCFSRIPIRKREADELKSLGYKLCFVSPELEGRDEDIERYKKQIESEGIEFDAICTKSCNIDRWR